MRVWGGGQGIWLLPSSQGWLAHKVVEGWRWEARLGKGQDTGTSAGWALGGSVEGREGGGGADYACQQDQPCPLVVVVVVLTALVVVVVVFKRYSPTIWLLLLSLTAANMYSQTTQQLHPTIVHLSRTLKKKRGARTNISTL